MQIIKYFMLFLILIFSSLIGKFLAKRYVYRLQELEELKNSLNIFKSKIKFTYEPIPEIFGEISKNTNYNISKLFKQATENMQDGTASLAWEIAVDDFSGNLNKEDKQAIKTLSKLLRNNWCRRTIESNWNNRELFRRTN